MPDHQRGNLFPEAALEDRKAERPIPHIWPLWKSVGVGRHQNFVQVLCVHSANRLDQSPAIPPQAYIEILQMPSSDDDLHGLGQSRHYINEEADIRP